MDRRRIGAWLASLAMLVPIAACDGQPVTGEGTVTHGDDTYDYNFDVKKRTPSPTPSPSPTASPTLSPTPTPSPTPPPEYKPMVGASGGTGSDFDALNATLPANGKMSVERVYETNIPTTWGGRAKVAHDAGRVVLISFKPNMAQVAAGTVDTAILAFLALLPSDGALIYLTFWHEPEDNIAALTWGSPVATSFAAFKGGINRLGFLVNVTNNANVKVFMNLMGPWTFWGTSPYVSWDWNNGFTWDDIDLLCADPYYDLLGNRQTSVSMDMNGSGGTGFMTYARNHNKPVALCEWGMNDPSGQTAKSAYITNTMQWAKQARNGANQPDVKYLAYFHYNNGSTNGVAWTFKVHDESRDAFQAIAVDARS